jgi:hypothetical protein
LNFEIHIIHNAFPGKTFERKCKGKQKFDIVFFNFVIEKKGRASLGQALRPVKTG